MSLSSVSQFDTAIGDIVTILITDEVIGVQFEPDREGFAAVIAGWDRISHGKFGAVQKHGGIHLTDVLFSCNDVPLDTMPHCDVLVLIRDRNLMKKTLKFMSSSEYYRRKNASRSTINTTPDAKNQFLSVVKKARITELGGARYVEYEIVCQMRVASLRVQNETIHRWSVWKRYSEFERLHRMVKQTLGWQMRSIEFPSGYVFVINKFSADFIERRRAELDSYWQKLLAIEKVTEFSKHHCSVEIKGFIDAETVINDSKTVSMEEPYESDHKNVNPKATNSQAASSSVLDQIKLAGKKPSAKTLSSLRRRPLSARGLITESAPSSDSQPSSISPTPENTTNEYYSNESLGHQMPHAVAAAAASTQITDASTYRQSTMKSFASLPNTETTSVRSNLLGSIQSLRKFND